MTVYQTITDAIAKGKTIATTWALGFINNIAIGEKNCCDELRLVVLTQWIGILQSYLNDNFDEDGSAVTPDYECLSQQQALDLVSKINEIGC